MVKTWVGDIGSTAMHRVKKNYSEEEILNIGLDFSMEFGKNWLKPIQKRLSQKIPSISAEDLDKYNNICAKTRDDGNAILFSILDNIGENRSLTSKELFKNENEAKKRVNIIQ